MPAMFFMACRTIPEFDRTLSNMWQQYQGLVDIIIIH